MQYQKALITGATSGLSAAFASILPVSMKLLLSARSEEPLRRVKACLPGNRRVACVVADLATADGRNAVIARTIEEKIDLLICDASIGWADFLDTSLSAARAAVTVNILAVMELLHALLPGMIARAHQRNRRAGVIIASSMGAFVTAPAERACYATSKMQVLRLAKALAKEHRANSVDVLALCPTWTDADFSTRAATPSAMEAEAVAQEAMTVLGRRTVHLGGKRPYPQAKLKEEFAR